jgi:hypothetical protein
VKPVFYVLGGVGLTLASAALSFLSILLAQWLFGPAWGIVAWGLALIALGGGAGGWIVYRIRSNRRV